MKRFTLFISAIVLSITPVMATVGSLTINHGPLLPSDSLIYSYTSTHDSAWSYIYIETGLASSGLDKATDKLYYRILMIDNKTDQQDHQDWSLFPDSDTAHGACKLVASDANMTPALYYMLVMDSDNEVSDTFRCVSETSPYRTVSGTVLAPTGFSRQWLTVSAYPQQGNMKTRWSAFTDSIGRYSIGISQANVIACSGNVRISIDEMLSGYVVTPREIPANIFGASRDSVNFTVSVAPCVIKGVVSGNSTPLRNVEIVLRDTMNGSDIARARTDSAGLYRIGCSPGTYRIEARFTPEIKAPWMSMSKTVSVANNDSTTLSFALKAPNAFIYGRVTKAGANPGSTFIVAASSNTLGRNYDSTGNTGWFAVPVVTGDSNYNVQVETWGDQYGIPAGYMWENQRKSVNAAPGDTVYFNLVLKPAGGISGTLINSTAGTAARYEITLRSVIRDSTTRDFWFDTRSGGAYVFDGIPPGKYTADAFMSVSPDEWQWKYGKKWPDTITVASSVVSGINFTFTNADTMTQNPMSQKLLKGTVANGSSYQSTGYEISLWQSTTGPQVRSLWLPDTATSFRMMNINSGTYLIRGLMHGKKDSLTKRDFAKWQTDSAGNPKWFDFNAVDSIFVAFTFTNADTLMQGPGPTGKKVIIGKITNSTGATPRSITIAVFDRVVDSGPQPSPIRTMKVLDTTLGYSVLGLPSAKVYVGAGISLDSNEMNFKYFAFSRDSLGKPKMWDLTVKDTQTVNITIAAADTTVKITIPGYGGKGVLKGSVVNSTGKKAVSATLVVFDRIPDSTTSPVRTMRTADTTLSAVLNGLPNIKLYVGAGISLDTNPWNFKYFAFSRDSTGKPKAWDFAAKDTHVVTITVTASDTLSKNPPVQPTGSGLIAGKVTYTGPLPKSRIMVTLAPQNKSQKPMTMRPDSTGIFTFMDVASGAYSVLGAIDTNNDGAFEAAGVSDSVIVIKGSDTVRQVIVVLKDRQGSGSIAGRVTYSGTLPSGAQLIVAAVPVDTMLPDSLRITPQSMMLAYMVKLDSIGSYTIGNLPDQVYYVLGSLESKSDTNKIQYAMGAYGQLIADTSLKFPFKPTAVVIKGNQATGINMTLLNRTIIATLSRHAAMVPGVFSIDRPVFSRRSGRVMINYGIPCDAAVTIRIMDIRGRTMATLTQGKQKAGYYTAAWSANGTAGGMYICRMETRAFVSNRSFMVVR